MPKLAAIGVAALAVASHPVAWAQDNGAAERGKLLYKQCAICHSLQKDVTRVGPSLHGLFGRRAASDDTFTYSEAFSGADFIWDDARLTTWLAGPTAMIPGNRMLFPGIKDPAKIADLITYLKGATR